MNVNRLKLILTDSKCIWKAWACRLMQWLFNKSSWGQHSRSQWLNLPCVVKQSIQRIKWYFEYYSTFFCFLGLNIVELNDYGVLCFSQGSFILTSNAVHERDDKWETAPEAPPDKYIPSVYLRVSCPIYFIWIPCGCFCNDKITLDSLLVKL